MMCCSMFKGNKIYLVDKNGKRKRVFWVKGLKIRFRGMNAIVELHTPLPKFKRCGIFCGNDARISIGSSDKVIRRLNLRATGENAICKIGSNFSATNICTILIKKKKGIKVEIGDNCMFGAQITLRTTDAHVIVDEKTGEVINYAKDVIIGDRCWLGKNVVILKGVHLAEGVVVGTHSLVTKDCPEPNSIYAGSPARLIRTGVIWHRTPHEKWNPETED